MFRHVCSAGVCLLFAFATGHAAERTGSTSASGKEVQRDTRPTQVTGEAYTQLRATVTRPNRPQDAKKDKKLFRAFLQSIGAGKDSREISVGVRVTIGNVMLPERSLATYKFDSGTNRLDVYTDGGYSFPLKRLSEGERIAVEVVFLDKTVSQYDVGAITGAVAALLPASSLVSKITEPAIQQLSNISSQAWNTLGSKYTTQGYREELSPYGSASKQVSIPIYGPGDDYFGTVNLSLQATQTLLHAPVDVFAFDPATMQRRALEHPSQLKNRVAGTEHSFADALRALPSYTEMLKEESTGSIRNFCNTAQKTLTDDQGLTVTDSTYVTFGAMRDAGFRMDGKKAAEWYRACFDDGEIGILASANGISLPADPTPTPSIMPNDHLYAFGCWMIAMPGAECAGKAPDPQGLLSSLLHDKVVLNIDSGFFDTTALGGQEPVAKDVVIASLKGSAAAFSCFKRGMLVKSPSEKLFRFEGEYQDGKIARIAVYPVSSAALSCTT